MTSSAAGNSFVVSGTWMSVRTESAVRRRPRIATSLSMRSCSDPAARRRLAASWSSTDRVCSRPSELRTAGRPWSANPAGRACGTCRARYRAPRSTSTQGHCPFTIVVGGVSEVLGGAELEGVPVELPWAQYLLETSTDELPVSASLVTLWVTVYVLLGGTLRSSPPSRAPPWKRRSGRPSRCTPRPPR